MDNSNRVLNKFYLETGAIKNFTKLMGDSIKFWTDLMNHPNLDAWWKERDARVGCKNIKPAMLIVGGLFDAEDCYGAWRLYDAVKKQSKETNTRIVMGPWYHGGWLKSDGRFLGNVRFESSTSSYYQQNIEIPFFNYYLKQKGSVKDISGAGDTFLAGLVIEYVRSQNIEKAIQFAQDCTTIVVQKSGVSTV